MIYEWSDEGVLFRMSIDRTPEGIQVAMAAAYPPHRHRIAVTMDESLSYSVPLAYLHDFVKINSERMLETVRRFRRVGRF